MPAPSYTLAEIKKLNPCSDSFAEAKRRLPARKKLSARMAVDAGLSLDDLVWVASALALKDKDIERRLRLWMADCAARVLHIYEKTGPSDAPRKAIVAARQFARGEIDNAAWAAAWAAAWDAAWDAARDAAWDAERAAAWAAAWDAAWYAARAAAWYAERDAAWYAERDAERAAARAAAWYAEKQWQLDRLVDWLSDDEPADWTLPEKATQ